eukprot:TRINITY_DN7266_c0_g1_i1.p1 TRINITY_DN7266_c0_g1~~TRINITY_DN7266_c0_g1_i1.p1  ORF type:complete len:227 (+),score=30.80 TRINITY_DN7266_c0_g1_i1:21-701(+)
MIQGVSKKKLIVAIGSIPVALYLASAAFLFDRQSPKYFRQEVPTNEAYELRTYSPYIKAELALPADSYREAIEKGTFELERYFRGENSRRKMVVRLSPPFVSEIDPNKLSQTVRVMPNSDFLSNEKPKPNRYFWVYQVLKQDYSIDGVPKPNNPFIQTLDNKSSQVWAAHRFSGWLTEKNIQKHVQVMKEAMEKDGLKMTNFTLQELDPWWVFWLTKRNYILCRLS